MMKAIIETAVRVVLIINRDNVFECWLMLLVMFHSAR